jgi:tetratricopeptide (TPR) repeat protein
MLKKLRLGKGSLIIMICGLLSAVPVFDTIAMAMALPQDNFERELQEADQDYRRGRFDEAVVILTNCLNRPNLTEDQKLRAYRLLGLAYIAKDLLSDARNAINKLLDLVPNYETDPIQDPPPFTRLVEEVRQNKQSTKEEVPQLEEFPRQREEAAPEDLAQIIPEEKKGGGKKWLLVGGLGVAGGVAALLLIGGGGGDGPPPLLGVPPSLPER